MELWRREIPTPKSLYGMSTSPIMYGDTLILVLDNEANAPDSKLSQSKIVAYDKSTGEVVWEAPRPRHRSGWSTPMIWKHQGGDELVVLGSGAVRAYDPADGSEKWFMSGFSKEAVAMPVAGKGHVYLASAQLGGGADAEIDPAPFWKALLRFDANGHLYLASERGVISVVKAGREFVPAHQYELGEPLHVTPAIDRDTIFFRSEKHLWAFRKDG